MKITVSLFLSMKLKSKPTYIIPSARSVGIGALVSGKVVDHDTNVPIVIERADAPGTRAPGRRRAIVLSDIVQLAILLWDDSSGQSAVGSEYFCTYLAVPGTCALRIGALITRENVDQDTSVVELVNRARTSPCATGVASNEDTLWVGTFGERRYVTSRSQCCISEERRRRKHGENKGVANAERHVVKDELCWKAGTDELLPPS
ncbi:hypothetical protein QCA50_001176 [Cerrena zonata]|uniref:Uncharacterized protein n=1 Tax=Cerrena zonata TaxID=2478898 RepID=A0AAW0GSZ4_9APHY